MRSVQEVLEDVILDAAARPARFRHAGQWHRVRAVLDAWRFGGRWWLGEAPRDCFLVETERLVAELHHEYGWADGWATGGEDTPAGRWWLVGLLD